MASGPGVTKAREALDMWLASGGVIRLWTVAPGFDGAGGTETVPSGGAPTVTFQPAVAGTGGQIAKAVSTGAVTFAGMAVASSAVVALSVHDPADNSIIALDSSWIAPGAGWAAGDSPQLASVTVPFVPVP
ncbi:MAG: hypothetical protein HOQ27_10680 [Dermatophilaceae bacterium]|nr:hypothetical protein [Dermatophilaceae bacterium]